MGFASLMSGYVFENWSKFLQTKNAVAKYLDDYFDKTSWSC